MTNRKAKLDPVSAQREAKNIGPVMDRDLGHTFVSVLLVERILQRLLQDTIDQFINDRSVATWFFSRFFDSTAASVKERDEFITNFMRNPPKAQLGYARTGAAMPVLAIVCTNEEEAENFFSDDIGTDPDAGPAAEYAGSHFQSTYTVYVYAEHPTVTMYLYQFAKSVVLGGKPYLISKGIQEITIGGGELMPDEAYMPDTMHVRAVRITTKQATTVPRILHAQRPRITGIHAHDAVVDGVQGGVFSYIPGSGSDE